MDEWAKRTNDTYRTFFDNWMSVANYQLSKISVCYNWMWINLRPNKVRCTVTISYHKVRCTVTISYSTCCALYSLRSYKHYSFATLTHLFSFYILICNWKTSYSTPNSKIGKCHSTVVLGTEPKCDICLRQTFFDVLARNTLFPCG